MNLNFISGAACDIAMAPVAAGTTPQSSTTFDMQGYETITALLHLGAITGSAVTDLRAQGGALANGGDAADLAGTKVTILDTYDNGLVLLEIVKPVQRYITFYVGRGTANAVINSMLVVRSHAHRQPVVQSTSDVVATKTVASPAVGTA